MNMFPSPDKSHVFLNAYHASSKCLIPGSAASLYMTNSNEGRIVKSLHSLNILNIGYHSYVSMSCVITDYIKHSNLEKFARISNLKFHSTACVGFLWFVWKSKKHSIEI